METAIDDDGPEEWFRCPDSAAGPSLLSPSLHKSDVHGTEKGFQVFRFGSWALVMDREIQLEFTLNVRQRIQGTVL